MVLNKIKNLCWYLGSKVKTAFLLLYRRFNKRIFEKHLTTLQTRFDKEILIGTKNGLFVVKQNQVWQILYGRFYGITFFGNQIYVFEKLGSIGRVIRFDKDFEPNDKFEVVIAELSNGCHQIDFIKDKLYITDTYNNRILIFNSEGSKLQEYYPLGRLNDGRNSENYGHINSIYSQDENFYLLCHNETKKTGRLSELVKLNESFDILERIKLDAGSAHNCVFYNDEWLICDSLQNRLIADGKEKFRCDHFTRGLAVFDDYIFVGGSEHAKREKRQFAGGAFFVLNNQFELVEKIKLPAMVQEIRGIDPADYSLSNIQC